MKAWLKRLLEKTPFCLKSERDRYLHEAGLYAKSFLEAQIVIGRLRTDIERLKEDVRDATRVIQFPKLHLDFIRAESHVLPRPMRYLDFRLSPNMFTFPINVCINSRDEVKAKEILTKAFKPYWESQVEQLVKDIVAAAVQNYEDSPLK